MGSEDREGALDAEEKEFLEMAAVISIGGFHIRYNSEKERWRADTLWTKEPETIAWLNSMKPGDVLFDIGANIGIYTLYAASRGIRVVAVEPVLENYARLVENVRLNRFANVTCIYGACGCSNEGHWFEEIEIPDTTIGASGAQLGGEGNHEKRLVPCYELEYLIYALELSPSHIKIDVDGQEAQILEGAVLDGVRSVLVEINTDQWTLEEAAECFREAGFVPDPIYNEMTPHSSERRQKEGIGAVNMVFRNEQEV